MTDFSVISRRYERESLVQRSAAELLMLLLQIGPQEDVLDLGCGTGHLSQHISKITTGRVLGVDSSSAMVAEARSKYSSERVSFETAGAEALSAVSEFDVIFCNSALQWFRDPALALAGCNQALRPGGRMGIQAPARSDYCPNFLRAISDVAVHPETAATYSRFRSPWFFRETADVYADIFHDAGFVVQFARIVETSARYSPEQVLKVFESGAAAGYLNAACYEGPMPDRYVESFRRIVARAFQAQTDADQQIDLLFRRIYLVAARPS